MSARRYELPMLALAWLALPSAALAQSMGMDDMPGMSAPTGGAQGDSHAGHDMPSTDATVLPPNDHIAPPPPQTMPHAMSPQQMADVMQMDDAGTRSMLLIDRLERTRSTSGDYATAWEAEGWWGTDINRLWVKTEGERGSEGTQDGRLEALWSHAWTSFWDGQLGVRQDFGQGPSRQWAAFGVEGLAPYWLETQATLYVGEQGRTAARFEASYELRLTQRLILQPKLELNIYGKDDPQRSITSGLSDMEAGLRLRYEFSRKFAPFIGVNWTRRFGNSDGVPGATDLHARETTWVAGVRLWF
jgi:copper resistance protein B